MPSWRASRSIASGKLSPSILLDEADGVAALAAAEAVVVAVGRVDGERRGLLVVEGAQALQPPGARRTKRHVSADDLFDRDPLTDRIDARVADATGHQPLPSQTAWEERDPLR